MDNPETLATLDTHHPVRRQEKQKTKINLTKMDNPETLATLDTHHPVRRQEKQKTKKTH
jgi:hypothetical protein